MIISRIETLDLYQIDNLFRSGSGLTGSVYVYLFTLAKRPRKVLPFYLTTQWLLCILYEIKFVLTLVNALSMFDVCGLGP